MNDLSFLFKLSPAERMQLAEDLWDSLDPQELPPLTEAQKKELDRRLADDERDPSTALDWADVRARLWARQP